MTTNSSISIDVEGAIHFVREKPLLALFLGFVFLRLLVWASGWGKVPKTLNFTDSRLNCLEPMLMDQVGSLAGQIFFGPFSAVRRPS